MTDTDEIIVGMIAPFPFLSDRGSPIRAANFAKIAAESVNINVVTYHLGSTDKSLPYDIRRIPDLPIKFREAGASYKKAICDVFLVPEILKLLVDEDVDILHAHLHEGCFAAQITNALVRTDIPVIYDAHGTLVEEMIETGFFDEDSIQRPFWEFLENRIQSDADYVLAQSEPRRQSLVNDGVDADRIGVIPDIVDTELFTPQPPKEGLLSELGIDSDTPVIMYTGTLQDYQGIPDLIKAFEQVLETNKDAKLVLVGGGELENYREVVNNKRLSNTVIFTGAEPFEKMPEYLSIADIAVGPRRYGENLPSKLLTYMAAGVATVSTDIPGVTTLITDWENGVVVPREQPDKLAKVLITLITDDTDRQNIAYTGRQTVVDEYSKAACSQLLVDLYHSLTNS